VKPVFMPQQCVQQYITIWFAKFIWSWLDYKIESLIFNWSGWSWELLYQILLTISLPCRRIFIAAIKPKDQHQLKDSYNWNKGFSGYCFDKEDIVSTSSIIYLVPLLWHYQLMETVDTDHSMITGPSIISTLCVSRFYKRLHDSGK